MKLKPCPFCGSVPDPERCFKFVDGHKWGAVVCCCEGPDVRTHYSDGREWWAEAAEAWNTRVLDTEDVRASVERTFESRIDEMKASNRILIEENQELRNQLRGFGVDA